MGYIPHAPGYAGLRHCFVSNQLAAGTPIHVVRDMAAHRSLAVTALYAHQTNEARHAAAQRVQINVGARAERSAPTAPEPEANGAVRIRR